MADNENYNDDQKFILHLRGLPYSSTEETIVEFLGVDPELLTNVTIGRTPEGRHSGEGYVVCADNDTAENCKQMHRQTMPGTNRYVEIFNTTEAKMNAGLVNVGNGGSQWDGIVKLRGLPFKSTVEDVEDFFSGLTWAQNGIFFPLNANGESSGESFVQFDTFTNANEAMKRNRNSIGGRYIELFKSSNNDMRKSMIQDARIRKENAWQNPVYQNNQFNNNAGGGGESYGGLNLSGGGGGGGGGQQGGFKKEQIGQGTPYQRPQAAQVNSANTYATAQNDSPFPHVVGVQGVPNGVVNSQIQDFFKPAKAVAINMLGNGHCDVAFKTHDDAVNAMTQDRMPLQGSAVNLTLKSQAPTGWSSIPE